MYFIAMLLVVKTVFFNTYLTQFVALNIRVLLILTWLLYINNLHIVSAALQCFAGLGLQYNEYLLVGYIEYAYALIMLMLNTEIVMKFGALIPESTQKTTARTLIDCPVSICL